MTVLHDLARRVQRCRGVLVDSNVLIDIGTNDPIWADWSRRAIAECAEQTSLFLNPIVYAEVSLGFMTMEDFNDTLPTEIYNKVPLPWDAGFLAGKAFMAYKRRGGARTAPLPDFYIGAHAAIEHLAVLTRDAQRFRSYFPTVEVLSPV